MSVYSDAVLALSPLAYWRMGEASGTLDNAEGTATYDAFTTNAPTYGVTGLLTGDPDTALSFAAGSSQYAQTNGALPAIGPNFSLAAWINVTSLSADRMVLSQQSNAFLRVYSTGQLEFHWVDAGAVGRNLATVGSDITTGQTYFIVGLYDGTRAKLYINGSTAAQSVELTSGGVPSAIWHIARHATAILSFDGAIDEVAIFDSVLSDADISNLWAIGAGLVDNSIPVVLLGGL